MKELLLSLLLCHVLGDYYFQNPKVAKGKETKGNMLTLHVALYALPFVFLAVLYGSKSFILASLWSVVFHGLIDGVKFLLNKHGRRDDPEHLRYGVDQLLHWSSILYIAYVFGAGPLLPGPALSGLFTGLGQSWKVFLQWLLAILLALRPSNITFQKLFSAFKPLPKSEKTEGNLSDEEEKAGAGAIIGSLEKLIALLCLAKGDLMAIGLILTAKSIARYDKISKSPSFAEYYLIGTLASVLMVLCIYGLCFILLA